MVSALFVLANFKGATSSELTTMIMLRNTYAGGGAGPDLLRSSQRRPRFLGSKSNVSQLQVTVVSAAPYGPSYSSIVYGQY